VWLFFIRKRIFFVCLKTVLNYKGLLDSGMVIMVRVLQFLKEKQTNDTSGHYFIVCFFGFGIGGLFVAKAGGQLRA
jgi:hypothetical protein